MTLTRGIRLFFVTLLFFGIALGMAGVQAINTTDSGAGISKEYFSPGLKAAQNFGFLKIPAFSNAIRDPSLNYCPVTGPDTRSTLLKSRNPARLLNTTGYPGIIPAFLPVGTGFLEGFVTIGPLCPVEPCQITDEQRAMAYQACHLVITSEGPSYKVYQVNISPDGRYRIPLPVGRYTVTIAKNGAGRNLDAPATVVIKSGKTVTLNLSVDTGIR